MSDDEDSGEGKVLGPMLDYTRYYPTTLPMHQPRQDDSAASVSSEEVGHTAPLFFSISTSGSSTSACQADRLSAQRSL